MTNQEELRDDAPPTEDDERRQMGEPSGAGEWDENEPSPHQGEEGQKESEA